MNTNFKVGDRVEFTEDYNEHNARTGDRGTVTKIEDGITGRGENQLVTVAMDDGTEACAYGKRMKLVAEFDAGAIVQLKDQESYGGRWSGPMVVTHSPNNSVWSVLCEHPVKGGGAFYESELELYVEPEKEEVAVPCTYRIAVGGVIGTKEYSCLGEAKDAAVEHGKNGEEFAIFEVVEIASYRVKTTTELERI